MPSADVFTEQPLPTANGVNGNGSVTDPFEAELPPAANGAPAPKIGNDANSADSNDPHGVVEINEEARSRANGSGSQRPHTPTGSMALTDYSINPSTPSEEKRQRIRDIVPEDFLLPNGHPDVSLIAMLHREMPAASPNSANFANPILPVISTCV